MGVPTGDYLSPKSLRSSSSTKLSRGSLVSPVSTRNLKGRSRKSFFFLRSNKLLSLRTAGPEPAPETELPCLLSVLCSLGAKGGAPSAPSTFIVLRPLHSLCHRLDSESCILFRNGWPRRFTIDRRAHTVDTLPWPQLRPPAFFQTVSALQPECPKRSVVQLSTHLRE